MSEELYFKFKKKYWKQMFEIYVFQENTTGWLSETIPRDLEEKTFIQVRCFCLSLRLKLNSIQLNPTKNRPE